MSQLPELLVERLRAGRCVLCAGAGLRSLAGMPTWSGILDRLAQGLAERGEPAERIEELRTLVRDARLFLAAGYIERKLGMEAFAAAVRRELRSPDELPEVIRMVGELPLRTIISTGGDDLLERAFAGEGSGGRPNVCTLADGRDLSREARGRLVLKVMGDVSRPETISLTARHFEDALARAAGYQSFGEEIARKRSLLFLGFAPEDPDFELLLDRFFTSAGDAEHEHYAFLPGTGPIATEELYARYRVRVIADGTLEEFVRALRAAVGDARPRVLDEDDLEGWLRWLALEPDSAEAQAGLSQLEERVRAAADWERLVEILLGRVEATETGPTRAALLSEVARIFENQLGDLPKAFTALVAAWREEPQPELLGELERLAAAGGLFGELVAEFSQHAEAADDPARWLLVGRWALERLGDPVEAVQALARAHARAPEDAAIADLYAEALRRADRWSELAALCERRAAAAGDPAARADLLLLLGDIYETRTGELEKAVATYRRAAELEGGTEALAQLERIFRRRERWRELGELLVRRAENAAEPGAARALRREAGEILADRVGDLGAAVTRLEAVVAEDPRDVAALRALERLYERTGQPAEILRTLERLAEAVDSAEERVLLLRRLAAAWQEREAGADRAAACLDQILELRPRDEEALRALERIYRDERRFTHLIVTLERHIGANSEPAHRRELYARIAQIYEEELREIPRAIEAWLNMEDSGGDALADLARLYQKAGQWPQALDVLPKLAARKEEPAERAELWSTAGRIAVEQLGDDAAAETHFAHALEADPAHLPSMIQLGAVYERRGDWLRAAKLMAEAAERTANRLEKARLLEGAGRIHQDHLDDEAQAQDLFARVLAIDPEHLAAGQRLADLYEKHERWVELEPVLDMLSRKADRSDPIGAADLFVRLGRTARQVKSEERAVKAYQKACELDPTGLEPLRGLSGLLSGRGEHAEAAQRYEALLEHHGGVLEDAERLDVLYRLASARHKLGAAEPALELYQRALEIDPHHRSSLLAEVELFGAAGRFAEVARAKRRLVETAAPDERVRLLEEIGDLWLEKLADPTQALEAFQEALALRPDRAILLHKVLDLFTARKEWRGAVDVIDKLVALESDPARRAKYRYAAAAILDEELGETDRALEHFEKVLDDAPDNQEAFSAITEILTRRDDWKGLERAYRRMIKRLPADGMTDVHLRLWSGLAELALGKLQNREVALAALEVATSLDPENQARHEKLAELYLEAGPDCADKAIEEHQILLAHKPDRAESYLTLRRLYAETKQIDKLWCLSSALRFLKRADAETLEIYERHRPKKFVPARRKLTEEVWLQHVLHPDEDRLVNAIFSLVGPALAAWSAQPHKAFGLSRKERTDPAQHDHLVARAFRYAVETLGVAPPDLFFRPEQPGAVQVANALEKDKIVPAFIVGAGLYEKPREKDVVFELARRLTFLRPDRYVRYALPTAQALQGALRAGLSASGARNGAPLDGDAGKLCEHLKRALPAALLEQLALVGRKLLEGRGDVLDLAGWLAASDLTASRAAFALANDFEVAARLVSTEQAGFSPLSPKERLKELLAYSVSEDYFAVRKQLGLEIEV